MKAEPIEGYNKKRFRVVIFGSARLEKGDPNWNLIYDLAKRIAEEDVDIVTGGGPGLMSAASEGHYAGDVGRTIQSIGLQIRLPKEQRDALHLDIRKEFSRFSERLDNFIELANAVIVAPGGVGTMLEFFYTWQ
ncbi:MAG: LOG family protein, partial [Candidatus Bathyarchaeota archaeon]